MNNRMERINVDTGTSLRLGKTSDDNILRTKTKEKGGASSTFRTVLMVHLATITHQDYIEL